MVKLIPRISISLVLFGLVSLFHAPILAAPNGMTDSYCMMELGGTRQDYIWTLDMRAASRMNTALNSVTPNSSNLTQSELIDHIDGILQSGAVEGRQLMRQRMSNSTNTLCSQSSNACIYFETGGGGQCDGADGPTMYAYCGIGDDCGITVCLEKLKNYTNSDRMLRFTRVFKHEFGHTFGANHVHDEPDEPGCLEVNNKREPCWGGWTDGVDGELMSTRTQCSMGTQMRASDGEAFRYWFNDIAPGVPDNPYFAGRKLYTGSAGTSMSDIYQVGSRSVVFRPRVDCATDKSPEWNCIVAQTYANGNDMNTKLVGLRNANSSQLWGTNSSRHTEAADIAFEGDVAISPDGEKAFFVFALEASNSTYLRAVDLSSTVSEPIITLNYKSAYTPRVAVNKFTNTLIVIGFEAIADNPNKPEHFGFLFKPVIHTGSISNPQGLTRIDDSIAADFMDQVMPHFSWDFDCNDETPMCVVVGMYDQFYGTSSAPRTLGRFRSTSMELTSSHEPISVNPTPTNIRPIFNRITGVTGVDLHGFNNTLTISASRRVSSLSTGNTRVARYINGQAQPSQRIFYAKLKADAQTCSTGVYNGVDIANGMSTWGGYDIAYGNVGSYYTKDYITVHMGRQSNNSSYCH